MKIGDNIAPREAFGEALVDLGGQNRDVVVFAFGERELRPYPPSPPQWLLDAQRQQTDSWRAVVTDLRSKPPARTKKSGTKKRATKAAPKKKAPKSGTAKRKKRGDGASKA